MSRGSRPAPPLGGVISGDDTDVLIITENTLADGAEDNTLEYKVTERGKLLHRVTFRGNVGMTCNLQIMSDNYILRGTDHIVDLIFNKPLDISTIYFNIRNDIGTTAVGDMELYLQFNK